MEEWPGEVEIMVIDRNFWKDRRVFLTGHTGFKGAWMALLLTRLGARVTGFALAPEHNDGVFQAARIFDDVDHQIGDIRDQMSLSDTMQRARPDIVIHMAAQPLVRASYHDPIATYSTNVMGTANLLEACRTLPSIKAIVVVTSDKCYENSTTQREFTEDDKLGGYDPYSSSKACAELVTSAYRQSFFNSPSSPAAATVRAGNVVGGGDWSTDRLVPDAIRSFVAGDPVRIRNPRAVRPWQHVLDALNGYLALSENLVRHGHSFAGGWNFGPDQSEFLPVSSLVVKLTEKWGDRAAWTTAEGNHPHEAPFLGLDCSKARSRLGWRPLMDIDKTLDLCVQWHKALAAGENMRPVSVAQPATVLSLGSTSESKRCEVCGNADLQPVIDLGLHPMCDDLIPVGDQRECREYPISILFCTDCRTAHQRYQIPKQELFPKTYHYRSRNTADVLDGMKDLVSRCESTIGSLTGKIVLDIGCNDGSLLSFFAAKGARTFGVEPTNAALDASASHTVLNEFFTDTVAERFVSQHGRPDIITFTNVFAHIEDLSALLDTLRKTIHQNTVVVIENHYLGAILAKNQFVLP